MLLNKFFITKVQNEHTCLNKITSRSYSRSEEQPFGRQFEIAASKHDENCLITFVPWNFPYNILSITACENQKLVKKAFLRASQSAEIDILVISNVLSIFLSLKFYPIIHPSTISLKRKTYGDVKGKLIQLLESVLSVS